MLEKITYKDVIRFTAHYWGQKKALTGAAFLTVGIAGFLDTLFPVLAGRLIGDLGDAVADKGSIPQAVAISFALFIGLELVYHLFRNGSHFIWSAVITNNLAQIIRDSFAKVQRFSTDWHANNFAGGTVRKITRGMWSFDMYADIIFMYLWPTSIVLVSTITLLTMRWPILGLVTLIFVTIYIAFSLWAIIVINAPLFRKSAAEDTLVGAALADSVTANSAVKAFGSEKSEDARFYDITATWRKITVKSWNISVLNDLIRRFISTALMAAMIGTAVWLWQQGRADAGDVAYVFTSFIVMTAYLRHVGDQISHLQKAVSEMEDVVFFWKTDVAVKDAPEAGSLVPGRGEIVFDKVDFAYKGQKKPIYEGFSLRIEPGEKVALVGHSGSGKSTFVKLVQRLYDIQGGEIRIDGQNIAAVTQESLRKSIALVPQEPILFHRSLAENIAYGKPGASMNEIIAAAEKAYAHEFIQGLPLGYDTLVGERGVKLSGGERQRVAIARAILTDAPILILDEATSSLDSLSEHYIQKALEELVKGRTTITIAHRLATIKAVDRILVFSEGSVVEQGTHAALTANPASHYKRLYDMQALDLVGEDYEA